tara:strand:- start:611 stop:886 length:276 start_codon:yes stop_codon:yes gene_type:complete
MSSNTRLWFGLINPQTQDYDDFAALTKRLTDEYNAFFKRIGYDYDKVWWNEDKSIWCVTLGIDGTFDYTNTVDPGFWVDINFLPIGWKDVA